MAAIRDEWAGIPLPLEDSILHVEPSYPYAKAIEQLESKKYPDNSNFLVRNTFYSSRLRASISVVKDKTTHEIYAVAAPGSRNQTRYLLETLGASFAWGLEQECKALNLLQSLISGHAFKQYMLTGMFLETSSRSKLIYLFRRLRPTVAIRCGRMIGGDEDTESSRPLAALCMHPIGYYGRSWAGALCPTDDVIAHLMLMRGDEVMFWRRCNQHSPDRPEAGL